MTKILDPTVQVAVVYHSGYGHTRVQAEAVAAGAAAVAGARAILIPVERHAEHWPDLDQADAIVFGCPTYMAGPSAPFKAFLDATSGRWAEQRWKNKLAAGFTNSAGLNGDKLATLQQLALFAMQHGMVWVGLGLLPGNHTSQGSPADLNRLASFLGAMAQSNADQSPELAPPPSDRATAEHLGARVAAAALRWRGSVAAPAPEQADEELAALRAVIEQYFDGLYRSDAALLAQVFHPRAHYATASSGSLLQLDLEQYLPMVAARPSPQSKGESRRDRIVTLELAGPVTALARVECSIAPKRFVDFLTLIKVDGRWQIIAKVFHYEIEECPCPT